MADEGKGDQGAQEPNLELPSLSLGLRRKKKSKATKAGEEASEVAPDAAALPEDEQAPSAPAETPAPTAPAKRPPAPPVKKSAPAPPARSTPTGPPTTAKKSAPPPPRPAASAVPSPGPKAPPATTTPTPSVAKETTPTQVPPVPATAPAAVGAPPVATPLNPTPKPPALDPSTPARSMAHDASTDALPEEADGPLAAPREKKPSRIVEALTKLDELEVKLPKVAPRTAALVTGLVCGLVAVLLAWLSASGCQAVRGTGTCGGFGLIALIAILAIEVILGGTLLRSWGINEPTSTAFLGVGLVAVAAMLFFLGSIGSVWMILVIPLLTAVMFVLSWWITDTVIDVDE